MVAEVSTGLKFQVINWDRKTCAKNIIVYTSLYILLRIHIINHTKFSKENAMLMGSVFLNNRTQAVRLPAEARFSGDVKRVTVRVVGNDRVLSPVEQSWDSFFHSSERVSDDFMSARASQTQRGRENF